jgi:hypothetical protein
MWSYLGQFWDAIQEVGAYPVAFFQSVGNAVAGAIGGVFEWLVHYLNDAFIFFGWIFGILKEVISAFVSPLSYIFNFLKAFTTSAFSSPQTPALTYSFNAETMSVFQAIPYWNVIISVIGVAILVICGIAVLKVILRLT